MLEELQRRNFSSETIRGYVGTIERFANYFGKRPDRLGPDYIRHSSQEDRFNITPAILADARSQSAQ